MRAGSRFRSGLLVAAVVLIGVVLAVVQPTVVLLGEDQEDPASPADVRLVGFEEGDAQLWAYTSRERDFETLTLPINAVVKEDARTTRQVLAADTSRSWTVSDVEGEAVTVNGSGVGWTETRGATRYVYVHSGGDGRWMDETAQLHDGAYLGSRVHIRLYGFDSGTGEWTALQAHTEHWDWFRLRHTVGSVAEGQYVVEHQFYGTGLLNDITRERFANGGILDSDGWVTVVDLIEWRPPPGEAVSASLALGLLLFGVRAGDLRTAVEAAVGQTQATVDHAVMVVTLLSLPLLVRVTAVELELAFPGVSPKIIAAPLYLVLVGGLPLVAGVLGRRLAADEAFAAATVGLGAGLLADYAYLGIHTLQFGVVVHRVFLLLGIGLIAAGGVRWAETPLHRNRYRLVGSLVWVGALIWPLAGL